MVVLAAAEVTSAGTQRQMVSLPAGALEGTGVLPLSQPFKLPGNDASPHTVTVVWSDDSLTWHTVDKGLHEDLAGIAYGNEKFVAAGRGGLIAVSAEGAVWHREQVPVSSDLLAVVFVGDTYVVVGASGTVLTSSDGSRWTQRQTGTRSALFGVAAQSVTILATGDNGVTLISPDAIHWSSVPTTSHELLYGCAAGGRNVCSRRRERHNAVDTRSVNVCGPRSTLAGRWCHSEWRNGQPCVVGRPWGSHLRTGVVRAIDVSCPRNRRLTRFCSTDQTCMEPPSRCHRESFRLEHP